MKANVTLGFSVAVLALATATPGVRISAAPNPPVKSGVDRFNLSGMSPVRTPAVPPTPPLWKSPGILHGFSRKTPGINQFTFLSVN